MITWFLYIYIHTQLGHCVEGVPSPNYNSWLRTTCIPDQGHGFQVFMYVRNNHQFNFRLYIFWVSVVSVFYSICLHLSCFSCCTEFHLLTQRLCSRDPLNSNPNPNPKTKLYSENIQSKTNKAYGIIWSIQCGRTWPEFSTIVHKLYNSLVLHLLKIQPAVQTGKRYLFPGFTQS